jgi:hypothetical protein
VDYNKVEVVAMAYKSKILLDEVIINKENRRFGSAKRYYPVTVIKGNKSSTALFTLSQLRVAMARYKSREGINE